jgi:two-component system NarL family sensor kinase
VTRRDTLDEASVGIAALRLLFVPVVIAGRGLTESTATSRAFPALVTVTGLYAIGILILVLRGSRPRFVARMEPVVDLILLCALALASGGAHSELRNAFFVVPLAAALSSPPKTTLAVAVATAVAYAAVVVGHVPSDDSNALETAGIHLIYLVWAGGGAVLLSLVLSRNSSRISTILDLRSSLVSQAFEAGDKERRRLADVLHDEPVQTLLSARQDLQDVREGDFGAVERADKALIRAVERLRAEIFDLHPHILDTVGLEAAVRAIAERQARRGGYCAAVHVDLQLAQSRDVLLYSVARELLINAARHAKAQSVDVRVTERSGVVTVEVVDDGVGLAPGRRQRAIEEGHFGLLSLRERVRSRGGELELTSTPGGGTRVSVVVP